MKGPYFDSIGEMIFWGACVVGRLASSQNTSPEEATSMADRALEELRWRAEKLEGKKDQEK